MIPLTITHTSLEPSVAATLREISRRAVDGTTNNERIWRQKLANVADSSSIANTTTETNFSINRTISISMFQPGRMLKLRASGVYSTTGTPTLVFKVKFGTTNLVVFAAKTGLNNASNQSWLIESDVIFRTIGASGTVMAQGVLHINTSAGADTIETVVNNATTTVNTTAVQTLQISLTWSVASVSNTATMKNLLLFVSDY